VWQVLPLLTPRDPSTVSAVQGGVSVKVQLGMVDLQPADANNERHEHTTWHFPQDPTLDFHNYTCVAWIGIVPC